MGTITNLILCSFLALRSSSSVNHISCQSRWLCYLVASLLLGIAQNQVTLEPDRPLFRVQVSHRAELACCYKTFGKSVKSTWFKQGANQSLVPQPVELSDQMAVANTHDPVSGISCDNLTFNEVHLNDSSVYLCLLNASDTAVLSHGTYLHVYKKIEKAINLSESAKNKILIVEGVLLLLCVLGPSASLLCQAKRINELERKKMKKEEENIYQGLNLDDCCSTYDQIERSQAHGPYQDVGNIKDEDEIQLEKP